MNSHIPDPYDDLHSIIRSVHLLTNVKNFPLPNIENREKQVQEYWNQYRNGLVVSQFNQALKNQKNIYQNLKNILINTSYL